MLNKNCIVLNASYEPLDIKNSREALIDVLVGDATPLKFYDYVVRSPSTEMKVPSVIVWKTYVHSKRKVYTKTAQLTQRNLFTRDNNQCQYCGRYSSEFDHSERLTRDHVYPRAKGGRDVWENVITSCSTCNNKKADFTLDQCDMELLRQPHVPTIFEIMAKTKLMKDFKDFRLDKFYDEVME